MTEVVGLAVLGCYGLLVALGVVPTPWEVARPMISRLAGTRSAVLGDPTRLRDRRWFRAVVAFVAVSGVVGTPLLGLIIGFVAWHTDRLRGLWRRSLTPIERGDAIASWAEMLADAVDAGRGVQQAVARTAPRVRPSIRPQAHALIVRLNDMPLPQALVGLDDELDHPCGDLLVGALILAAAGETQDVTRPLRLVAARSRLLSEKLASADAKRGGARKTVRTVLWTFGIIGAVLLLLLRPFLDWYRTSGGQVFLAFVVAATVWALMRLRVLAELRVPERVLDSGLRAAASPGGPR